MPPGRAAAARLARHRSFYVVPAARPFFQEPRAPVLCYKCPVAYSAEAAAYVLGAIPAGHGCFVGQQALVSGGRGVRPPFLSRHAPAPNTSFFQAAAQLRATTAAHAAAR
eukprot:365654-Chlamydomonas_euryale.AAC.1